MYFLSDIRFALECYLEDAKKEVTPEFFEALEHNVWGMYNYLNENKPKRYVGDIDIYLDAVCVSADFLNCIESIQKIKNFEQFYTSYYQYVVKNIDHYRNVCAKCGESMDYCLNDIKNGFINLIKNAFND